MPNWCRSFQYPQVTLGMVLYRMTTRKFLFFHSINSFCTYFFSSSTASFNNRHIELSQLFSKVLQLYITVSIYNLQSLIPYALGWWIFIFFFLFYLIDDAYISITYTYISLNKRFLCFSFFYKLFENYHKFFSMN